VTISTGDSTVTITYGPFPPFEIQEGDSVVRIDAAGSSG